LTQSPASKEVFTGVVKVIKGGSEDSSSVFGQLPKSYFFENHALYCLKLLFSKTRTTGPVFGRNIIRLKLMNKRTQRDLFAFCMEVVNKGCSALRYV
jgi:hypothetical protein